MQNKQYNKKVRGGPTAEIEIGLHIHNMYKYKQRNYQPTYRTRCNVTYVLHVTYVTKIDDVMHIMYVTQGSMLI